MYGNFTTFLMVYGTMLAALVLNMVAPPDVIRNFYPNILLLTVMFWTVRIPRMVSVGHAFCAGLMMDLLLGSTLGIRAFSFSLMIFMLTSAFSKLETYSMLQQSVSIAIISFVGQIATFWLEHLFGMAFIDYHMILSSVSDMVMWPIMWISLGFLMRFRHVRNSNLKH